jgi:glycosyltransferase involved in cell wall biosynthesis
MSQKTALLISFGYTAVTGFSNQTWLLSRALVEDGWKVYVAHREYRGEAITFENPTKTESGRELTGTTMLPWGNAPWGEDIIPAYISNYKPNIVFTLGDIWCYQYMKKIPRTAENPWNWIAYYEFDTENMVYTWNESLKNADISVVPAKFSYNMCLASGHKNIVYVPHSVDTKIFEPTTPEEKNALKKKFGFKETDFLIGCVSHNQPRKKLYRLLHAFKLFTMNGKNPDAKLFLHTTPIENGGWDLSLIAKDEGIADKVFFTNKASKMFGDVHTSEREIRDYYCSLDIHALPTGGEGFGVPLIEAMSCGIPNVATAYTTPKEFFCNLTEDGQLVNIRGFCIPYTDLEAHPSNGMWALIDVRLMAQTFQSIKDNPNMGHDMGQRARQFVIENYDIELVKGMWKNLFNNVDKYIIKEEPVDSMQLRAVNVNGQIQ